MEDRGETDPRGSSRTRLIPQSSRAMTKKYTEPCDDITSSSTMIRMNRRSPKQDNHQERSNKRRAYDKNQALSEVSTRLTKRKLLLNQW